MVDCQEGNLRPQAGSVEVQEGNREPPVRRPQAGSVEVQEAVTGCICHRPYGLQ